MKITIEDKANYILINLSGRLDVNGSEIFEHETDKILNEYDKNVIIDCNLLDYLSSSGLRVLLVFIKKLDHKKKRLVLCCPNQNVMDVLNLASFEKAAPICTSLKESEKII